MRSSACPRAGPASINASSNVRTRAMAASSPNAQVPEYRRSRPKFPPRPTSGRRAPSELGAEGELDLLDVVAGAVLQRRGDIDDDRADRRFPGEGKSGRRTQQVLVEGIEGLEHVADVDEPGHAGPADLGERQRKRDFDAAGDLEVAAHRAAELVLRAERVVVEAAHVRDPAG